MKPLKVAVVGLGIGRLHLKAYQNLPDHYQIYGLCDLDPARLREYQAIYPQVAFATGDYRDLLQRDEIDIIDLCTPPFLHYEQIREALKAGKHVFCEKPLVSSLREVDSLQTLSTFVGKCLMPIFQFRHGEGIVELKNQVEKGNLGRHLVSSVEIGWSRPPEYYLSSWRSQWESSFGGTLVSHICHLVDLLTWVIGMPESITANGAALLNDIEVEDTAAILAGYADGSMATIVSTTGAQEERAGMRFCFENLTAESNRHPYDCSQFPWRYAPRSHPSEEKAGEIKCLFGELFRTAAERLWNGEELPVTLADARNSIEILSAAYLSISRGGTKVRLPISNQDAVYNGWLQIMTDHSRVSRKREQGSPEVHVFEEMETRKVAEPAAF